MVLYKKNMAEENNEITVFEELVILWEIISKFNIHIYINKLLLNFQQIFWEKFILIFPKFPRQNELIRHLQECFTLPFLAERGKEATLKTQESFEKLKNCGNIRSPRQT